MENERRQLTVETILVELGVVRQISSESKDKIESLNDKVAIQNGRVGKLEIAEAQREGYLKGLSIFLTVISIIVIPMALIMFSQWVHLKP